MKDYGKVFSRIWESQDFRALSEDGRSLVLYLLTCQHGTIAGAFRVPDGYACEDLQWSSERVSQGFSNLTEKGFATRCDATKWVWVTKFLEWNPPENPNQVKAALKIVASIPDQCAWKRAFMRVCGPTLGVDPTLYLEPLDNPLPTVPQPVSGTVAVAGTVATEPDGSVGDAKPTDPPPAPTPPPPPPPAPPTPKAEKRAARKAPADFEVTDEMRVWAAEKAPYANVDSETEAFKDHTFKDSKLDWPGTWRNWLRKASADRTPKRQAAAKSFQQADLEAKVDRINRMTGGLAGAKPVQADFIDMEVPRGAVAEIR